MHAKLQMQRQGMRHAHEFQKAIKAVLADLKNRGPPAADDYSIGALLLKATDTKTGNFLPFPSAIRAVSQAAAWQVHKPSCRSALSKTLILHGIGFSLMVRCF